MPHERPVADTMSPVDPLYHKALTALDCAAWWWQPETGALQLSPEFCRRASLADNSITHIDQLLAMVESGARQAFMARLSLGILEQHQFFCQLPLQLPSGLSVWEFRGRISVEAGRRREVSGLLSLVKTAPTAAMDLTLNQSFPQRLLDGFYLPVCYLDPTGVIRYSNRAAQSMGDGNWQAGEDFATLLPFVDGGTASAIHRAEIAQVVATGLASLGHPQAIQLAGRPRYLNIHKTPTFDAQGQVEGVLVIMEDITDAQHRESALAASEERYKAVLEASHDVIWCYQLEPPVAIDQPADDQVAGIIQGARLVEYNQHFADLFRGEDNELLGSPLPIDDFANLQRTIYQFVAADYQLVEKPVERRQGTHGPEYWQITTLGKVEDGYLYKVWGTSKNITDRKRYLDKLQYQATHDALTQLPNRTHLHQVIERALNERPAHRQMALLIIDLDRFKEINDTLGHHVGDKVLRLLGPRLEAEMEDLPGTVVRLGGDEFAIFLSSIRNQQQAVVFGHRVLDSVQQPFMIEGYHTEISASVGVSVCPNQADDVSTLMRYADVAMYRAKQEMLGVALYNPETDPHSPKRLALMGELGKAIREDQLRLHYQPKIDLARGTVSGFEALLRWQHPTMGMISPGEFIPIAENTGIIQPMTLWVLENSIQQCKEWLNQGMDVTVAVNLSTRNLLDDHIVATVDNLLQRYGLPARHLELEITESAIIEDPKRALLALNAIHDLGVKLAIDDFGTGYSSLAYLKRLPVQMLKIDYTFVINMLEDEQDKIIVNSTIHLAHNLGLQVVAEGVESEAILAELAAMGCDQAQGFYVARPMPKLHLPDWLRDADWGHVAMG